LVEIIKDETAGRTKSGIVLPEYSTQSRLLRKVAHQHDRGKVIAIGKDVKTVKPGDEIIYERFGSTKIIEDEKKYYLMPESDINLIVEEVNCRINS
jgi:chaperonin GroES